jgi:hypothetical protein
MTTKGLLPIFFISIGLWSCGTQTRERPSPLRADSMVFKSNLLHLQFSSPAVNSRNIWGDLVPYDQMWRTGGNEASTFSTSGQIKVAGHLIDSGKYAIFSIPSQNQWQIIFNEHWNQWGTFSYDSTLDVARILVNPRNNAEFSERMKFYFESDSLKFQWEHLAFSLALE